MSVVTNQDWRGIYRALAHEDRRQLLQYVLTTGKARIEDVAHALSGEDGDPSTAEIESATIMLYHVHLPVLTETALLTWDPQENRIIPTALASHLPTEILSPSSRIKSDSDTREAVTE